MTELRRLNVNTTELQWDADDPDGFAAGYSRFGPSIGAAMIGATVYELPPDQSNCPYHYEYGNEEWVLVLAGRLSLRHPEGEAELEAGEVVCFVPGPAGAHRFTNRTTEPARFIVFSTKIEPSVAVYPDSDKLGVWPGDERDKLIVRRSSNVDYYEGEL
ncbi:MAG TPA: cupin domain-containing protein [Gaiellaceae bacterium]